MHTPVIVSQCVFFPTIPAFLSGASLLPVMKRAVPSCLSTESCRDAQTDLLSWSADGVSVCNIGDFVA